MKGISDLIWTNTSIKFLVGCHKTRMVYENSFNGISFLLIVLPEMNENIKILFEINEKGVYAQSNKHIEKPIGWLNIPDFTCKDFQFLWDKNYFKERNSISMKIFTNKYMNFNFENINWRNKVLYLIISVEKEEILHHVCNLIITRKKKLVDKLKNIIFCKMLNDSKIYFPSKISLLKIKHNMRRLSDFSLNLNLIHRGIDFTKPISINKTPNPAEIFFHFKSTNQVEYDYKFTIKNFKVAERYIKNHKLFSSGVYCCDELKLEVDNAQLILPSGCLDHEEVISIMKCIRIEWEEESIKIFNLIKCFPHPLNFKKPLRLIMKSPTNNPLPLQSDVKLLMHENGLFEQFVHHFCHLGLFSKWNKNSPYKKFHYYFEKKDNNILMMSFSIIGSSCCRVNSLKKKKKNTTSFKFIMCFSDKYFF